MKRILVVAAAIAGLLIAWLALGRQLVLAVDAFTTDGETVALSAQPLIYSASALRVVEVPLDFRTPDGITNGASIDTGVTGGVSLHADGQVFPLGQRVEPSALVKVDEHVGPFDALVAPDPGDTVSFRTAHSAIAWPTPFDLNFMTGKSPGWRRNTYYTLIWRKRDGATLEMTWRYEQWFYDDWASPMMTSPGRTGLISVAISP
jgi:hypothetical protein